MTSPAPRRAATPRRRTPPTTTTTRSPCPSGGDNATAAFRVQWATPVSDWDVKLYEDTNGNGLSDAGEPVVGTSAQGTTDFEEVTIARPVLAAGKKLVLRVVNFAAAEPYTRDRHLRRPAAVPRGPGREPTHSRCERDGQVLLTQPVIVDRGASVRVDPCPATPKAPAVPGTPDRARR